MLAIKIGELPIIDLLLKAGAKVNVVEKLDNQTPLMWAAAAQKNAPEMVKLLLAKGASVKARAKFTDWPAPIPRTARSIVRRAASLPCSTQRARLLCLLASMLEAGAGDFVNLPTPEGVAPLIIALDNEQNEIVKLLLDRGANPAAQYW